MRKLPAHIQAYLETSPYGPFSELEIGRLTDRLTRGRVLAEEADVERDLLALRAARDPTPRNIAIFNNAISSREKAKGRHFLAVVCPCGSRDVHYDVDGPNPLQQVCDHCDALVSQEHIRRVTDATIKELGDNIRRKLGRPPSN